MTLVLLFLGGVLLGHVLARIYLARRRHYVQRADVYPATWRDPPPPPT